MKSVFGHLKFWWQSTHRHQQVCFWPDVSTFILRSSSKDMRGDLRSDSYVLLASWLVVHNCRTLDRLSYPLRKTLGWRSKRQAKNKLAGVCECFVRVFSQRDAFQIKFWCRNMLPRSLKVLSHLGVFLINFISVKPLTTENSEINFSKNL